MPYLIHRMIETVSNHVAMCIVEAPKYRTSIISVSHHADTPYYGKRHATSAFCQQACLLRSQTDGVGSFLGTFLLDQGDAVFWGHSTDPERESRKFTKSMPAGDQYLGRVRRLFEKGFYSPIIDCL